ncbi:hypothetical protein EYF80_063723 [Liparis tanakae]|uniref:Uncharacterized protein n=1 Tax=Liparis tanakae TaxID=230148 RepID=A0A4Z2EBE2_9TELE|nr:hypothetical protein EYF80_063723 [Liparis tanakae]
MWTDNYTGGYPGAGGKTRAQWEEEGRKMKSRVTKKKKERGPNGLVCEAPHTYLTEAPQGLQHQRTRRHGGHNDSEELSFTRGPTDEDMVPSRG